MKSSAEFESLVLCLLALGLASDASFSQTNLGVFVASSQSFLLRGDQATGAAHVQFSVPVDALPENLYPLGGNFEVDRLSGVAIYDSAGRQFHFRHAHTTGDPNFSVVFSPAGTAAQDVAPILGDWTGEGIDSIGVFKRPTAQFYLRYSNTPGEAQQVDTITNIDLTQPSSLFPVIGKWGTEGTDRVGVFHSGTKTFYLRSEFGTGNPDYVFTITGLPTGTYVPVSGDWNGDGQDSVGVFERQTSVFYLRNSLTNGPAEVTFEISGAVANALPVAGDWDGAAIRLEIPPGALGEKNKGFHQLVQRPGSNAPQFDLYFPAKNNPQGGQHRIMYNSYSESGQWLFPESQVAINHEVGASTALGSVLISSTPDFEAPSGATYKRIMYYVYQVEPPTDYAGWVCIAYSNDGLTWTSPIMATRSIATTPRACAGEGSPDTEIPVEALSGFRVASSIYLAGLHGIIPDLVSGLLSEVDRTYTYLYEASLSAPWVLEESGEFSNEGIERPNTHGRYQSAYGVNVDFTMDQETSTLYLSRVYSYAFDVAGSVPCGLPPACRPGPFLLPVRAQVLSSPVGPLGPGDADKQSWQLQRDYGASVGYSDFDGLSCVGNAPLLFNYQRALGLDINSISFYKDGDGLMAGDKFGNPVVIFGAGPKDRVHGNCEPLDNAGFPARNLYLLRERFSFEALFSDGFENGNSSNWSTTFP